MTLARRARARPCACPRLCARVGRGPSGTGRGGGHRFRSVPSPAPSWKLSISRAQLRGASRGEKVRAPTRCGQRSDLRAGALQARSDRRFLSAGALRGVLTDGTSLSEARQVPVAGARPAVPRLPHTGSSGSRAQSPKRADLGRNPELDPGPSDSSPGSLPSPARQQGPLSLAV